MDKYFEVIDNLVKQAAQPLNDPWLDEYYAKYEQAVSTRLNYYRFLYLLVKTFKPAVSIELGVEFGVASAHMAVAALDYDGIVIGVDINTHGAVFDIIKHCENYNFRQCDTAQAFPDIKNYLTGANIGLVFQDSSHHYFESKREFELYSSLMPKGAIWVCDDILPAFHDPKIDPPGKSMVEYFWEIPRGGKKLYTDVLNQGNTMGVIIL